MIGFLPCIPSITGDPPLGREHRAFQTEKSAKLKAGAAAWSAGLWHRKPGVARGEGAGLHPSSLLLPVLPLDSFCSESVCVYVQIHT